MDKVIRFVLLVAGSLGAWGLWFVELRWIKGWAGLAWLTGFNWSALPICLLIAVTTSYFVGARRKPPGRFIFVLVTSLISIAAFTIERQLAFHLFSGGFPGHLSFTAGIAPLVAGLAASGALAYSADRWLAPMHFWAAILLALAFLAVLPLSFATIKHLPAINGSIDQIHSIKMGYPVFWSALLTPLAVYLGQKRPEL